MENCTPVALEPAKILIVDDVAANRFIMRRLLSRLDAEILEADSGPAALELAQANRFALFLLDVQMPIMSGYEVAQSLRRQTATRYVPIIFITAAYKDEPHQIQAYGAGAVDYIEKPFNDIVLLSKVRVFLELYQQRSELQALLRELEVGNQRLRHEVAERVAAERQLHKLSQVVEQNPASVIITDLEGKIEFVNARTEQATGYQRAELIGQTPSILRSGLTPRATYKQLWQALAHGEVWRGEFHNRKKTGELYWEYVSVSPIRDLEGKITHYVATKEDISLRKSHEQELLRQNNFDDITHLPNRVLALDRLSQALASAQRTACGTAVVFIDLDNFKKINETRGHTVGDEVLVEAARRLSNLARKGDTIARFGGDEFLLVLPDCHRDNTAELMVHKILHSFSTPFVIEREEFVITASLGISYAPEDSQRPEVLLQNAEAAMYRAKEAGRNTYRFFTRAMNEEAALRLEMENLLRQALRKQELSLHYQPQLDARSGRLVGVEVLLRWYNAKLGQIGPDVFVPLAEAVGLIESIGDWVIRQAVRQVRQWQLHYWLPLRVAVNLSSRQFYAANLPQRLDAVLRQAGLAPADFEVEITESLLMHETETNLKTLRALSELGVRLSVDDFGTGYSSLSYLKKFPVDVIKIDKGFILDLTSNHEDAILVKAIIGMAHGLGLSVVAEGVETEQQLAFLRKQGCDLIQGYYFSPPLPPDQFETYLANYCAMGDMSGDCRQSPPAQPQTRP